MTQVAKAQEPSMEEILASIRRIIADDDGAKKPEATPEAKAEPPAARAAPPPPPKPAPAPPPPAAMKQDDIDAMLAGLGDPEPAPPKPAREPEPEPEPDVLELTESMQAPAAPAFRTIDAQQDVVFDETAASEPAPPPPRAAEPPRAAPPPRPPMTAEPDIMSSATAAAVDSAFNALAHTVLVQNAKTLEDLVKEMLRPMLQHWLDNNLPTMVERLVRQEIERVARGRG
jgi:cell pole-organizing protein PopZ